MPRLVEPELEQVLAFCAEDPVERVFLEDMARRGMGRFTGLVSGAGLITGTGPAAGKGRANAEKLVALCHVGANLVPSGRGCGAFAGAARNGRARMIIGEEGAVTELWKEAVDSFPAPREDRPGQPVFRLDQAPEPGDTRLRSATLDDLDLLVPAAARDPPRGDRHRSPSPRSRRLPLANEGADRGRPVVALGRERDDSLQGGGVRLDAVRGPDPAGLGRPRGTRPRLRPARDARPLPAAARLDADGVPLRPPRECARAARLRGDRHAAHDHVPEPPLLVETAILVRHAESELNPGSILNGDRSVACGLSEHGRKQARRLGALARPDAVVTSSFQRARETADAAWPRVRARRTRTSTRSGSAAGRDSLSRATATGRGAPVRSTTRPAAARAASRRSPATWPRTGGCSRARSRRSPSSRTVS